MLFLLQISTWSCIDGKCNPSIMVAHALHSITWPHFDKLTIVSHCYFDCSLSLSLQLVLTFSTFFLLQFVCNICSFPNRKKCATDFSRPCRCIVSLLEAIKPCREHNETSVSIQLLLVWRSIIFSSKKKLFIRQLSIIFVRQKKVNSSWNWKRFSLELQQ